MNKCIESSIKIVRNQNGGMSCGTNVQRLSGRRKGGFRLRDVGDMLIEEKLKLVDEETR